MKSFKDLIPGKNKSLTIVSERDSNPQPPFPSKSNYFQQGYDDAKNASGNTQILGNCLNHLYQDFKTEQMEDEVSQKKLKLPHERALKKTNSEIEQLEEQTNLQEETIQQQKDQIQNLDHEMIDVKADPSKYGLEVNKRPRAQFYIGLGILLPITVYLFVFYISASYSAFFKNFESNILANAIFDGQALSKAFSDGVLEGFFVLTIPFVFMGLGYLLHMFQKSKSKNRFQIIFLYVVTFIFDAILAYLIEKKIYDIDKTLE
ncbi:MAG: ABC transporter permease, partial [Bacteroidota bacterium]